MALRDILVAFNVTVDQTQLVSAQQNVNKLISSFNGLARAAQFALAALGIGKLTDSADEYINIENKLKAVTNSTEEFAVAQRGVEQISKELMQPLQSITDAYLRYSLATESLNVSQEEQLDFTKRVTQAMILSGATAEEAHRAAVQLAQGFGKNFKAAAQDLKSVKEQAPVLARIIEKAAGAAPGALLQAAKAGQITSRLVFDAVRDAGTQLDNDWAKRGKRFEDIGNLSGNLWLRIMKALKPTFSVIIDYLEQFVGWMAKIVENGDNVARFFTILTMAVGALTVALAPLAAAALATIAPFAAWYLVLQDLYTFLNGGDSLFGRAFDALGKIFGVENGAEQARKGVQFYWEKLQEFLSWLSAGGLGDAFRGFYDSAVLWLGKTFDWIRQQIPNLGIIIADTIRGALGSKVSDFLGVPTGAQVKQQQDGQREVLANPELSNTGAWADRGKPYTETQDYMNAMQRWHDNQQASGEVFGPPTLRQFKQQEYAGGAGAAPVITTNVTVEGNATPAVAREVADRAGEAAAAALGRDRTAVGAGFGVQP